MIKEKLLKEIKQYCELNEIDDIVKFVNDTLTMGFNIQKYGTAPESNKKYETTTEEVSNKIKEDKKNIYGD